MLYTDHRDGNNHIYDVTNMQYNAKASESVTYENIPLKEVQVSTTQQHKMPTAEGNVNMQTNPSYLTVDCSNPQVN